MKAAMCARYGPPESLEIREIAKPAPGDNEVLVKVIAATVNRTDCGYLRASPFFIRLTNGLRGPKNPVLGSEFAGQIESVGAKVTKFKPGDRVFGFNEGGFGGHAEYLVKSEDSSIATIPEGISYEQAAASSEGSHYAYNMIKSVGVQQGQHVLVNGASGAIGSAAVQLLRYFGANITAVCGTKNVALVKSLGADRVIDHQREDFTEQPGRYRFIFDTGGNGSFVKCRKLLEPGGVFLTCDFGPKKQNIFFILFKPFIGDKKVSLPIPDDAKGDVRFVRELMASGKFKAVIDRAFPFERIIEAYNYVETGQKTGSVVLMVTE